MCLAHLAAALSAALASKLNGVRARANKKMEDLKKIPFFPGFMFMPSRRPVLHRCKLHLGGLRLGVGQNRDSLVHEALPMLVVEDAAGVAGV